MPVNAQVDHPNEITILPQAHETTSQLSLPIQSKESLHREQSPSSQSSLISSPPLLPSSQSSLLQTSSPTPEAKVHSAKPSKLSDFFGPNAERRVRYSDGEIQEIARQLRTSEREAWSQAPRLYIVLRTIGQLQAFDTILDHGIGDIWFPFNASSVPTNLSSSLRAEFLDSQQLVLTKAVDLEKSEQKKHAHFGRDEAFPFEVRERLGRGASGTVDKVFSPFSRREFARKRFARGSGPANKSEVHSFKTELQVLKRIQHHHCIELVASYTDSKFFGIIMSPVADCNLKEFYARVYDNPALLDFLRGFYGCLANGLSYLHNAKIRHRDIKPENILVKGAEVYLTDFGISLDWENMSGSTTTDDTAKSWYVSSQSSTLYVHSFVSGETCLGAAGLGFPSADLKNCFTPSLSSVKGNADFEIAHRIYCAPEVAHIQKRNTASDIWSLGCVFLEMSTCLKGQSIDAMRQHFKALNNSNRFYQNVQALQDWSSKLHLCRLASDNNTLDWALSMLQIDPEARPTADDLCATLLKTAASKSDGDAHFFGDCCAVNFDVDSTSGSVSDGDIWAEDLEDKQTSPLHTDDSLKSHGVDNASLADTRPANQIFSTLSAPKVDILKSQKSEGGLSMVGLKLDQANVSTSVIESKDNQPQQSISIPYGHFNPETKQNVAHLASDDKSLDLSGLDAGNWPSVGDGLQNISKETGLHSPETVIPHEASVEKNWVPNVSAEWSKRRREEKRVNFALQTSPRLSESSLSTDFPEVVEPVDIAGRIMTVEPDTNSRHHEQGGEESFRTLKRLGYPSIKFRYLVSENPNHRPSLWFEPISRILPHEDCVIRVGRYSNGGDYTDPPPNTPTLTPTAAPIGFKSKVVSRRHCEFWCVRRRWYIKDVRSSSGTFLNKTRLSQPDVESDLWPVNDGDELQLGIDYKGGQEEIFRCVKMRIECDGGSGSFENGPQATANNSNGRKSNPLLAAAKSFVNQLSK